MSEITGAGGLEAAQTVENVPKLVPISIALGPREYTRAAEIKVENEQLQDPSITINPTVVYVPHARPADLCVCLCVCVCVCVRVCMSDNLFLLLYVELPLACKEALQSYRQLHTCEMRWQPCCTYTLLFVRVAQGIACR